MSPGSSPLVSVVVAVYRRPDFLRLVLDALARQTDPGFEVIVAEDNDGDEIAGVVAGYRQAFPDRLQHVTQHHFGFGKNRILNAALRVSRNPFMVFLDGDCVPHPSLVAVYRKVARPGRALFGRRAMVGPGLTAKLLAGEVPSPPSLLALLRSDSTRVEDALRIPFFRKPIQATGIWGCNWGVLQSHLEEINGYDEDYGYAAVGEDLDLEWRLKATGVVLESVKHRAIVYHLHHPANYSRDDVDRSFELHRRKMAANQVRCLRGMDGGAAPGAGRSSSRT
jgi:glycosyltransferase involved in cell wall biosynthesis